MAGRIRTIKPELLEDDVVGDLSDAAWRLWVSMFVLADDYGNVRASRRALAPGGRLDGDVMAALNELAACKGDRGGLVQLYEVRGQRYASICGWSKHQKIQRPGKPRCPGPEEAEITDVVESLGKIPVTDRKDPAVGRNIPAAHRKDPATLRTDLRPTTTTYDQRPTTNEHDQRPVHDRDRVCVSDGRKQLATVPLTATDASVVKGVKQVFDYWRRYHPEEFLTPHPGLDEWIATEKRIARDGCTAESICKGIDGMHLDDWEGRERNLQLKHVVKDLASVQRFIRIAEAADKPALSEATRKSITAGQKWLERTGTDDDGEVPF
jgi:hypothetical protein